MSNSKLIPVGFDNGNGFSKLMYRTHEVRLPSTLSFVHTGKIFDSVPSSNGSFVEYLAGDKPELEGQAWLTGYEAQTQYPSRYVRVVDSFEGKVDFGLQLLLGALGTVDIPSECTLAVVSSINNADVFGPKLNDALSGFHRVRFNGSKIVNMTIINKTVEEGQGVVRFLTKGKDIKSGDRIGILDIGYGTIISSVYQNEVLISESRGVINTGVENLVTSIAKSSVSFSRLRHEAYKSLIMEGIERGNFVYGTTGWCFADVYEDELRAWVKANLAVAMKGIYRWQATCSKIFAVGGGSQLPEIGTALASKGLTILNNPHFANAKGLQIIAQEMK